MPDLMLELIYADGEVRQGAAAHWPHAFPRKQPKRVQVRRPRGPFAWELHAHQYFALAGTEPVTCFDVDFDEHTGQVRGEVWTFRGGSEPEVTTIDVPITSPTLPPLSAFIPSMGFMAPVADRGPAWLGNWDWVLRRWRARRR